MKETVGIFVVLLVAFAIGAAIGGGLKYKNGQRPVGLATQYCEVKIDRIGVRVCPLCGENAAIMVNGQEICRICREFTGRREF